MIKTKVFLLSALIIVCIGCNPTKHTIYIKEHVYFTDYYEEKEGCIYFTSYTGQKVKHCGYYTISS